MVIPNDIIWTFEKEQYSLAHTIGMYLSQEFESLEFVLDSDAEEKPILLVKDGERLSDLIPVVKAFIAGRESK